MRLTTFTDFALRTLMRLAGEPARSFATHEIATEFKISGHHLAKVVRDLLPKAHFATVYAKPMGRPLVDTFITEISQNTWIHFPWDTGLAFQPPIRPPLGSPPLAEG